MPHPLFRTFVRIERLRIDRELVALGRTLLAHGNPSDPGYRLLHPETATRALLPEKQADIVVDELSAAYDAGFVPQEYNPFADPGSYSYDPETELEEGQSDHVDWEGLSRYVASGEGGQWFGNFEDSRNIRRAANARLGLETTGHDLLLGQGPTDAYDQTAAAAMLMGLATSTPVHRELLRGSYVEGADPAAVEAALRVEHLDFSLVSFTNHRGVADYFADPSLYQESEARAGTQVMFVVEPGAQGIAGRIFPEGMRAGHAGEESEDEDDLTDFSLARPREIVTGGRFAVRNVVREGNRITVRLRQEYTYDPRNGEPLVQLAQQTAVAGPPVDVLDLLAGTVSAPRPAVTARPAKPSAGLRR